MRASLSRLVILLALASSAATGCDKGKSPDKGSTGTVSPSQTLQLAQVSAAVGARTKDAFERPAVQAAMNDMFSAVGKDPALSAAGGKLFAKLGEDPKIAGATQTLMGQLTGSKEIQQMVMAVMAENPGASPDQVGELVGKKFAAVWDTPEVTKAFSSAFDKLLARLNATSRMSAAIAPMSGRLDGYIDRPDRLAAWSDRLKALNGGSEPSPEKATQLYVDHAWSSDRIEAFAAKFFKNPAVRREATAAIVEVLQQPAVQAQITQVAGDVATDPAVQSSGVQLMLLLTRTPVPQAELEAQLTTFLTAPSMTKGLDKLVALVFDDPKVAAIARTHLDAIIADPGVKADFDDLLDKW